VVSDTLGVDIDTLLHEDELLHAVSAALQRMDEGTYGRCASCGEWIERERLEVLPYAERCIACARRRE
jgi:DnaK suppressor protein